MAAVLDAADRRRRRPHARHPPLGVPGTPTRRCRPERIKPGPGPVRRATTSGPASPSWRRAQLTFEAWCYHRQIPEVTALARAFPDTTIILDHFGGPLGIGAYAGQADEVYAEWQPLHQRARHVPERRRQAGRDQHGDQRLRLARAAARRRRARSSPTPRGRYYEFTIEKFGADRCMFESNFPVDKVSCSYTVLWNSFKRLTAGYSAAEKAKLFHDTAARVYRLETY